MLILIPLVTLFILLIILISQGKVTMKTRSSSVNESSYFKYKDFKKDIYQENAKSQLLCPFNINIEPIEKLILFDIEDDPLYLTIELQEFNDDISNGLVIILYRKDKEIDVYYTEGIKHDYYKGTKNGINHLIIPEKYTFGKNTDQLTFILQFTDKYNNTIFVEAIEKHSDKKHFDILAPAGDMIENFTSFPLFFMQKTAFLEKNYTTIDIKIAGEDRKPVAIPIAINGKFVYLSRYCLEPVAVSFNENFKGTINTTESTNFENYQVKLNKNSDNYEIEALTCNKYNHKARIRFAPPIPELLSLKNNTKIKGRFSTSINDTSGLLAGEYLIVNSNGKLHISLSPKKGWQPMPGKKWFKKYRWISAILQRDKSIPVKSLWLYNK